MIVAGFYRFWLPNASRREQLVNWRLLSSSYHCYRHRSTVRQRLSTHYNYTSVITTQPSCFFSKHLLQCIIVAVRILQPQMSITPTSLCTDGGLHQHIAALAVASLLHTKDSIDCCGHSITTKQTANLTDLHQQTEEKTPKAAINGSLKYYQVI